MDDGIRIAIRKDPFELEHGYNYDYVMVFQVHGEDVELTKTQKEWSMRAILNRLSTGGLETKMFYSVSRNEVFCKIRGSVERLCKEADRIDYKLELDPNELRKVAERGIPSHGISPIIIEDINRKTRRSLRQSIFWNRSIQ